ncbi:hypothetical protein AX774_g5473, partial [Zancudomyces culisetae]
MCIHNTNKSGPVIKPATLRVRKKMDIRLSENIQKFSIGSELDKLKPDISLGQLLQSSPEIRKELVDLFKKIEVKELNTIVEDWTTTTNCKAYIEVFGKHQLTVIDTGAACSVISEQFMDMLGLKIEQKDHSMLITADGTKHETLGIIRDVPFVIAGFIFPGDLVVMEGGLNRMVLGADWLLKHQANI